ncbi:hypothetical protein B0H21DRAFT_778411 [Amylocystis lapponica]|nr:hypothetical protein B0H21DRAFT_778411 [Amylocystis lapponica]
MDQDISGYTLMVAGRRTSKTSFLRLLLDTSIVSQNVSRDQLASVSKFVQGCSGHTSHVRAVSIEIDLTAGDNDEPQPLSLTLIDTPSLDFDDEPAYQRTVSDILRHVDSRFVESIEDERKALAGDHHVHLCIYFLDPDLIVPPVVPAPPVPVSRARTNSLSHPDAEPVILEPSVTANPILCRPTLPAADIATIRRLSSRVNVLPVVACADTLTNERLAAVKMAIRRDLAEAGIGFGIFDLDTFPQQPHHYKDSVESSAFKNKSDSVNGYNNHVNVVSSNAPSPPSTPASPSILRLPFALISPDIYSHSDGVSRTPPSRHELLVQYTPSHHLYTPKNQPSSKAVLGKFTRSYRWGSLDVMDASHCDFLPLRGAIFHHMQTLQKYTREYLLDKFRAEFQLQNPTLPVQARAQPSASMSRLPPISQGSRPVLAIDTAPSHMTGTRHTSLSVSRGGVAPNGDAGPPLTVSAPPTLADTSPKTATSSRSQRQRAKKITVACNFCRSRKLKCDGGRPACSQCSKRSNPCDYMANHKRRGNGRQRKQYAGSDSEGESGDDHSAEVENPSQSPEVVSQPPSRRNSNVSMLLTESLPPLSAAIERREETSSTLPPIAHATSNMLGPLPPDARLELPPIATLSSSSAGMGRDESPSLPSIKAPDAQTTQRRRTSSATSGKSRTSNHGSKIVACNICRARKTRCDGAHPVCGSCARRSLACNYVNDPGSSKSRGKAGGATPPGPSTSTSSRSSPSVQLQFPSAGVGTTTNGYIRAMDGGDLGNPPPHKKMRIATEMGASAIAVAPAPGA